jgi:hypothetical protein
MELTLPLTIQRLELVSQRDNGVLAYQLVFPYQRGVSIGPLGGVQRWAPFAPYGAIFREAIISTSPFYRLHCACGVYEGSNTVRRWMKEQRTRFNLTAALPKDPNVDTSELQQMGLDAAFCSQIKRAADLFEKLRDYRNGIAPFLVEGKQRDDPHVPRRLKHPAPVLSWSDCPTPLRQNSNRCMTRLFQTCHGCGASGVRRASKFAANCFIRKR